MFAFFNGAFKLPIVWQVWLGALVAVNAVAPLFFLSELPALVTFVATMTGAVIGMVMAHVHGFTKLLGVMHGPWVPMVVVQYAAIASGVPQGNYGLWLKVSAVISTVSLVIDIWDVIQYAKGNRADLLQT